MPARDFATDGTCTVDAHNEPYNDHIDSLEARIASLEGGGGGVPGLIIHPANYADQTAEVGSTINVPPGVTSGRITNNFFITTMNLAGVLPADQILVTFQGDTAGAPTNPATRRVGAVAGTGSFILYISGADSLPVDWTWVKRS